MEGLAADGSAKDLVKWKIVKVDAFDQASLADPTTSASYKLCIYDSAGGPDPVLGMDFKGASTCNGKPCWKATGDKGFKFKDKEGTPLGVTSAKLRAGEAGKAQTKIRGKGFKLPSTPLSTSRTSASNS